MKTSFVRLICILICPAIASSHAGVKTSGAAEEYARVLQVHHKNATFLAVRDDFRDHLNQDITGLLVSQILRNVDLRGMLFANFDAAPAKSKDIIVSEYLEDDANWYSNGDMLRSPALGMAAEIIERFDPDDWMDISSLTLALEDRADRLAISSVLRDLAKELESPTGAVTQDIRNKARDEIVKIVAMPVGKRSEDDKTGKPNPEPQPGSNGMAAPEGAATSTNNMNHAALQPAVLLAWIAAAVVVVIAVAAWLRWRRR